MQRRRFWRRLILISLLLPLLLVWATDYWVSNAAGGRLYSDLSLLPHRKVGLLLGAPKYSNGSVPTPFYQHRIDAAAALFKAGKIDYILVSGDGTAAASHQPDTMRADLIAQGVPAERIVLDPAGFRTLDSILRCRVVFGEDKVTLISQRFHNERALFLADRKGIDAIAFNAADAAGPQYRQFIREKLARVKMMLDLATGKKARMYGPKVQIG